MEKEIRKKYDILRKHLDEKSKRLWCATEALPLGRGGITIVSNATGVSFPTIRRGIREIKKPESIPQNRIRIKGGGRKSLKKTDKRLKNDLEKLVEPTTRGDPESPLKWTLKSTRNLAEELNRGKHRVSHSSVGILLHEMDYSLQGNKKTLEGATHPDRDAQFLHINKKAADFLKEYQPVISVDTKKKENIGNFKNNGKEYRKKGDPIKVNGHDFPDKQLGKVAPYGVYDIDKNIGWVSVGISSDTAKFAVQSIRSWWYEMGEKIYPHAQKILITADCGGSNSYRTRLWKVELQKLATELKREIHVSHFPPGTSKWNKIEHKMFCFISSNWRGKPLIDQTTVVNLIANTKTKKGLKIQAKLDKNHYEKGIVISDKELAAVHLLEDPFHGKWNYSIMPNRKVIYLRALTRHIRLRSRWSLRSLATSYMPKRCTKYPTES